MLGPLLILALLSLCGGWIGIERFSAYLAPVTGLRPAEAAGHLELILGLVAIAVAAVGWLVADRLYRQRPEDAGELAAAYPAGYKLLANKYYVDEFYGFTIIKPLFGISRFLLEWVVDVAILGGVAWLLGGIALLSGAILQRWQSGNIRSYAAWLAAGAAALFPVFLGTHGIGITWKGW